MSINFTDRHLLISNALINKAPSELLYFANPLIVTMENNKARIFFN